MLRRRVAALRRQSRLMVAVIVLFVLGYWLAGYGLFYMGFDFLMSRIPGVGSVLLDRMVYLFFAFLLVMLFFSNMIIGYSTFYKSPETQWMLTWPVGRASVFRWKWLETAVLASWAFLFLSAPFVAAYGVVRHASGWFYVKVFFLFGPFAMIPAALGALVVLMVARYFHRRVLKLVMIALTAAVIAGTGLLLKPVDVRDMHGAEMVSALNQLLRNSQAAMQPLLPSYWISRSMIAWGEGWSSTGNFFFLVLLSNALMAGLVCAVASDRLFYEGWSRLHGQGPRLHLGVAALDRSINLLRGGWLDRLLSWLPGMRPGTRALVAKDVRTFWRDATQWSQFVIFFGLLGLYVLNLRNVAYDWRSQYWVMFLAFLNLGATSMTLATLTTRFVFPQFSLEGRRLWIVGASPYGLKRVLLEKFWLSSIGSIVITLGLAMLCSAILGLPVWFRVLFGSTVVLMSFALCGIAVGTGALFPNLDAGPTANRREDNPARIVSGFGGTFCFVLSLLYLTLVIGAEALPIYWRAGGDIFGGEGRTWAIISAWAFVVLLSLAATCIPMAFALRRVEKLEI